MLIQGGNKPRQFNEHTENKTDLKNKTKQTREKKKKKVSGMISLCLGNGSVQKNTLLASTWLQRNQCKYAAIWGQRDGENINYKTPFQQCWPQLSLVKLGVAFLLELSTPWMDAALAENFKQPFSSWFIFYQVSRLKLRKQVSRMEGEGTHECAGDECSDSDSFQLLDWLILHLKDVTSKCT